MSEELKPHTPEFIKLNRRRLDLINRFCLGEGEPLTEQEQQELDNLQKVILDAVEKVYPRPIMSQEDWYTLNKLGEKND